MNRWGRLAPLFLSALVLVAAAAAARSQTTSKPDGIDGKVKKFLATAGAT